ncbi:alpha/beta family hydrolase [Nocardioides euryhalodurans]|uniref:Hydrolase n=1 Tax=Nocardioides euryhalodurans TaxID=2518370 RepID=A0A4P7GIL8_9ACTN|nr:alpha/beta family hydrolase [Nocardioides euryhalodurans]QBR91766.1 hydrolase [Nocardioides euryhalodurans]
MSTESRVPTPHGDGRSTTYRARRPIATLLLSHGAGAGVGSRDLQALAAALPRQGITVVLFDQPWVLAGRKVASPPPTLDDGLRAAAGRLRRTTPLVVGGRSAGARSAARCASGLGAAGCLALAFPLHPPGRPEKSRLDELLGAGVPTLVVQGERDTFGRPDEFPDGLAGVDMSVVPGGDHGFAVPKRGPVSQDEALGIVVEATLEWMVREVIGESAAG